MPKRFTDKSRTGRGKIPRKMRLEIYERDEYTCRFCNMKFQVEGLSIDHLVPVALGGIDEMTNYVTCCLPCNRLKSDLPLDEFAERIAIEISDLPVHGDPIIDNVDIPIQIRLLRKQIYDQYRVGKIGSGKGTRKKIEREYRISFWKTEEGQQLKNEFPNLPGQARQMIPQIETIAKNTRDYLLLVELSKSASTRNLIGDILTKDTEVESTLRSILEKHSDEALKKRIRQAITRFEKEVRKRGL